MIRELLLCLSCYGFFGVSWGNNDLTEAPICEDIGPSDIYLDLSNMNLEEINKPFASSTMIKCLNFAGNHIGKIVPNAFDGLPELSYLNLAENPIWYKEFTKTKLSNLRTLILDGPFHQNNPYHERQSRSYYDEPRQETSLSLLLPELKKLSLQNYGSDNKDLVWYSLEIIHVPNLTHLYLSHNTFVLGELINVLPAMDNLTHLYLDNTDMTDFHQIFLPNLRYLSFNENRIKALGNGYYGHMKLGGIYNLEYLSITNNEISTITPDAFQPMKNLRFLDLTHNKIEHFPPEILTHMGNLTNLTLDFNLLTDVPRICELVQLRSISLSGNRITSINKTTFCNLKYLSAIYLKNTGLTYVEDKTFGNLPALLVLDLSWNNILFLPEDWMAPRNFIMELRLDGNKFTDIESMSLEEINGLQTLSIGHNPMEIITILSMINLPNSTRIDVSRNSLSPMLSALSGCNN